MIMLKLAKHKNIQSYWRYPKLQESSAPLTANPQSSQSINGDYVSGVQQTVTDDALNNQQDQLTVQQTGEPLSEPQPLPKQPGLVNAWTIFAVVFLLACFIIMIKIIREYQQEDEEDDQIQELEIAVQTKNTSKKKSAKKKSAPNQRRKNTRKRK